MDFGVILLDIIMLLFLTFGLGMLVGNILTKKYYDNEKTVKKIIGKNMSFLKMRNREYDSNGSYMYPYGDIWGLDG